MVLSQYGISFLSTIPISTAILDHFLVNERLLSIIQDAGVMHPNKLCPVEKSIPRWRDEVEPYKQDAAFWHSIWESAGRPTRGVLRDLMAKT